MRNIYLRPHCIVLVSLTLLFASCRSGVRPHRVDDAVAARADVAQRVAAPGLSSVALAAQVDAVLAAPLTEQSAMRVALAMNPDVREGYERLGVARYDLMQAGLLSNPTIGAEFRFYAAGPEIDFGLTKPLVDLLYVRHRAAIADAERRAVEADVTAHLVGLYYEIRRAILDVQAAQRVIALREEGVALAETTGDLFATLSEAGNILNQAKTTGDMALSRAQLRLADAQAHESEHRVTLRRLLGVASTQAPLQLHAAMAEQPPEAVDPALLEQRAARVSLDVAALRADAQASRRGRRLQAVKKRTWIRDGGAFATREAAGEFGAGPGVEVELPIFDSGAAAYGRAAAQHRRACAMVAAKRLDVRAAAVRLGTRLTVALTREKRMREEYLPLRKRYVGDLVGRYNDMQIGAFDVLAAKMMEIDARREHVENLRNAWHARADVDELRAGHLNPDRLDAPDMPEEADHPALAGGGH